MQGKFKEVLKESIDSIDEIDDVFEDFFEDLPENMKDARDRSKAALKKIRAQLDNSLAGADTMADEVRLQAHLGLMEARDRVEASQPVIDELIEIAHDRSAQLMDEAQLQGHLAAMEAEDYWERDGRDLARKFADSSDDMLQHAADAIEQIQDRLNRWSASLKRS